MMAVVSCFAIQHSPSHCAYCGQPLKPHLNAWRSSSGKMYCSEFCADDEEEASPLARTYLVVGDIEGKRQNAPLEPFNA